MSHLRVNYWFSAPPKTLELILELSERSFSEIAAHGDTGAWGLFDRLEAKNCAISLKSPAINEIKKFQKFISIIEINEWNNWGITQVCGGTEL